MSRGPCCLVEQQLVGAGEAEVEGPAVCRALATGLGRGREVSALRGIADGLPRTSAQASARALHQPAARASLDGGSPASHRRGSENDADPSAQRCWSLGHGVPARAGAGDRHVFLGVPVTGCQRPEGRTDPRAPTSTLA